MSLTTLLEPESRTKSAPPVDRPVRILVADDESRIRLAVRACLEGEGYLIAEARDGLEAMSEIIQWAPDVMILDIAMPTLDGIRTLTQLEGVHGGLKPSIIVLTAWGSVPAAMRAIGLGAAAFVEKPVEPAFLRSIVARVVKQREAERESVAGVPIDWDSHQLSEA